MANEMSAENNKEGDFLPDLCSVQAVFALILVGELLSLAFVVIDQGLLAFEWTHFGAVSFLVQWIILASAACLCPLRPWFRKQNGIIAGTLSYLLVLILTVVFSYIGTRVAAIQTPSIFAMLAENVLISAIFSGVVLRYFYLQQQLHNREQAELQSRIQALQSRIRPHFLFNSMNSIASLIDIDPKAAEKMVVDLSQLFRASLSEATTVTLKEEIHLCKQFVSIEQTRLGSRLQVEWNIDTPELSVSIPSLLLQPLIENAIYHGVQPIPSGGVVRVDVSVKNEEVKIVIRNPFDETLIKTRRQSNGIALDNIRNRLMAFYGERARFTIEKGNNEFQVSIIYPLGNE
ncbi:MAG: sensor histidine kinase [Agarilytica sp.]